MKPGTIKF